MEFYCRNGWILQKTVMLINEPEKSQEGKGNQRAVNGRDLGG